MENEVIFRDRQEMQAGDLNNLQNDIRVSFDHIVADTLDAGIAYSGFVVSKTNATQVTASPGRFYNLGGVFPVVTNTLLDLFGTLPVLNQKYVAIVANGVDVQTDTQPRDFLIDVTTGNTEPEAVPMEDSRRGALAVVAGVESTIPTVPSTAPNVAVVAYILLGTTGIISIQQITQTQLANAKAVEGQVLDLQAFRRQTSGQLDSLGTALANINAALKGFGLETEIQTLNSRMNELTNEINALSHVTGALPWVFYGNTFFLDGDGCDTGNGSFTAIVSEGIGFSTAAHFTGNLACLTANDPLLAFFTNYTIPTYTHKLRLSCQGYASELAIGQFAFQSGIGCVKLHRRRHRRRFGPHFQSNRSADWWKVGGFDPVSSNLAFDGESAFAVIDIDSYVETVNPTDSYEVIGQYNGARRDFFWEDEYSESHWDRVTDSLSVSGFQLAQTFLNAQDGWLTQIGWFITRLGNTSDFDIKICHVDQGNRPDLSRTIYSGTLSHSVVNQAILGNDVGLVITPPTLPAQFVTVNPVETQVPITPTFLSAGKRYAIVVTTSNTASFAMTTTDQAALLGSAWYKGVSGEWTVDTTKDVKINLYYARFPRNRFEVNLAPLALSGGITAIDILAEAEVPPTTALSYQVQISGIWYPLGIFSGVGPDLSGLPVSLPFRVVFIGTQDLMPGLGLSTLSALKIYRGSPNFVFLSTATVLAQPVSQIKLSVILDNFNPTFHTATIKVHEGSTDHTPDTITDTTLPDGSIKRDCLFNIGGAQASGTVAFTVNPSNTNTITIGGTVVTFVTGTPTGNQVLIDGSTLNTTLQSLLLFLNTSQDANLQRASYSLVSNTLHITYNVVGTVGNTFATTTTVTGTTLGATLSGGVNATPVSTYHVEIDGVTTSISNMFHLAQLTQYAR